MTSRPLLLNSLGVLKLTKTGRVTHNSRSAASYCVRVVTDDGRVYRSKRVFDGEFAAAAKAGELLRSEGLPSTWDPDVLTLSYVQVEAA